MPADRGRVFSRPETEREGSQERTGAQSATAEFLQLETIVLACRIRYSTSENSLLESCIGVPLRVTSYDFGSSVRLPAFRVASNAFLCRRERALILASNSSKEN